jgi:hypothetical protein
MEQLQKDFEVQLSSVLLGAGRFFDIPKAAESLARRYHGAFERLDDVDAVPFSVWLDALSSCATDEFFGVTVSASE